MLNLTGWTWIRFGIWLLVGTAIYVGYGYWYSVQGRREASEPNREADPDVDASSAVA